MLSLPFWKRKPSKELKLPLPRDKFYKPTQKHYQLVPSNLPSFSRHLIGRSWTTGTLNQFQRNFWKPWSRTTKFLGIFSLKPLKYLCSYKQEQQNFWRYNKNGDITKYNFKGNENGLSVR